jgi:integrase
MLDEISDENGPIMAERTLAYCSKLFNWHEVADDTFRNPVVKGMSRIKPSERARKRILSDDELKILWATTNTEQSFDRMIRFILLTATRRNEAANMVYSEVTDGVWTIPPERSKSKVEIVIPLSQAAQDILAAIPRTKNVDYVFAAGWRPIADFSRCKSRLDARAGFTGWTIHDLRRTSRSLMARAGVSDEVGERCVGHILPGVLGIYNRHQYLDEKREAFGKLEAMVASIVLPEVQ